MLFGDHVSTSVASVLDPKIEENFAYWVFQTPRLIDGSYGEAPPFDLCYTPSMFMYFPTKSEQKMNESSPYRLGPEAEELSLHEGIDVDGNKSLEEEIQESSDEESTNLVVHELKEKSYLRAKHKQNHYLTAMELDVMNR